MNQPWTVTVEGVEYDVDAPDQATAWAWGNQFHQQAKQQAAERQQRIADRTAQYQQEAKTLYDPTAGMSGGEKVAANLGAGVMDWWEGGKQLLGKSSGADYREKRERDQRLAQATTGGKALQLAGNVLPAALLTAPLAMAAPAVGTTIAGGAALGAGTGLLSPTEFDSTVGGKALNTALGAVTGGAANKLVPMIAPALGRTVDAMRRMTQGGREQLARKAFMGQMSSLPQSLRKLTQYRDIPGTQPTTAQILNDPAMLATERRLGATGGEAAQDLAARREASNAARYKYMEDEFRQDVPKLQQSLNTFGANKPQNWARGKTFNQRPVIGELTRLQNSTNNPAAKAALEQIKENVRNALASGNPLDQLHQVRMFNLDDRIAELAKTDKKAATALSRQLESVKTALDQQLDAATGGKWTPYLQGYSERATRRDIGQAGADLMKRIDQAAPDNAGIPTLSSVRQSVLRKEAGKLNDFDKPVYGDTGNTTMDDVLQSLDVEARTQNVRPAGSATAANLSQGANRADQLLRPLTGQVDPQTFGQRALGNIVGSGVGGTVGAVAGGLPGMAAGTAAGGAVAEALQRGAQSRSLDIARRLYQMNVDPQRAVQVLNDAVRRGQIPMDVAQQAMQLLQQGARRGAQQIPLAAGAALPNALQAQQPAQ